MGSKRRCFRIRANVQGLALGLALLVPGVTRAGDITQAGVCANCHFSETGALVETDGHASTLDCQSCHADRRPGRVGPGHRSVPRCRTCHEVTGHPPRSPLRKGRGEIRNCSRCHAVHGSLNLALVPDTIRTRGRLVPMRFDSLGGATPGGFTNPDAPGTGLCEVCHKKTRFYPSDGTGEPHFTDTCIACHEHAIGFDVVATDENCGFCHTLEAERFTLPSAHSAQFKCSGCHAEVSPAPGPDHRAVAQCADCHDTTSHAPGGNTLPCSQCHEPHGTTNLDLVVEALATTEGPIVPIRFDDLAGRADGSFASASQPGTGVCEVCHTTTLYYRADGDGAPHFTVSCLPCHRHSDGFAPR